MADRAVLTLGTPSLDLLSTGVIPKKLILLNGNKLLKIVKRLGINAADLTNLPQALHK